MSYIKVFRSAVVQSPVLFDQVVYSASSAAFAFALVYASSAETLGRYSLAIAVTGFSVGLARAGIYEHFYIHSQELRIAGHAAIRRASFLAAAAGTVVTASVLVLAGSTREDILVGAGYCLVSVSIDGDRYASLIMSEHGRALLLDGAWLVLFCVAVVAITLLPGLSLSAAILTLAYSGAAALVVAANRVTLSRRKTTPRVAVGPAADLDGKDRVNAALDYLLNAGSGYAALFLIPVYTGLAGLGSFRATLTLYQPLVTFAYAWRLIYIRSSRWRHDPKALTVRLATGGTALSILYGGIVVLLFERVLSSVVPSLARVSVSLVIAVALSEGARIVVQVLFDRARLLRRSGRLVPARAMQAIVLVTLSLSLGRSFGLIGFIVARLAGHLSPIPLLRSVVWLDGQSVGSPGNALVHPRRLPWREDIAEPPG